MLFWKESTNNGWEPDRSGHFCIVLGDGAATGKFTQSYIIIMAISSVKISWSFTLTQGFTFIGF